MSGGLAQRLRVSRFVKLSWVDGGLRVFSPRSGKVLKVGPDMVTVLHEYRTASTTLEVADRLGADAEDLLEQFVGRMLAATVLVEVKGGLSDEEREPLATWEPDDLIFHTRSRSGLVGGPLGGTYRFRDRPDAPESPPAAHGYRGGRVQALAPARPDPEFAALNQVLGARRSVRAWGPALVRAQDLSDLLFHAARTQRVDGDTLYRPYPSGGGRHSLGIVLVLAAGRTELEPGVWRYDHEDHQLEWIADEGAESRALQQGAIGASGAAEAPPVLALITSRYARTSWKYERIAYATILKEVGCLLQTLSLVGEALGLASCALGCGDSVVASRVLGTDLFEESTVGEIMFGRLPE